MSKGVRWFLALVAALFLLNLFLVSMLSHGGGLGGLGIGETAPAIDADGWLIGDAPSAGELDGKVRVVVAWAFW